MNIFLTEIKNVLSGSKSKDPVFRRNVLKEYLQVIVLDFIYSHKTYSELFFYGGSCLSHCYGLPRLSEDLDFVDIRGEINLAELAKDLSGYIKKETDLELKTTCQKFRVYLKFPVLHDLGFTGALESDFLFLKVEVFNDSDFSKNYKTEHIPLFKQNRSMIIKTFDLPTLMATKIRAVLMRKWERTNKAGEVTMTVKGRDYFDLMWYMERGVKPNMACIPEAKDLEDLKNKLLRVIDLADAKSIRLDLESFIDNERFLETIGLKIKDILNGQISKL